MENPGASPSPREVVESYLARVNEHDPAGALEHLSDSFRLEFPGGATLTKDQVAAAMGWDVGTEGRVTWTVTSESGRDVRLEGTETNEFLRRLGLGPLDFSSRFEVDEEGRIATQTHDVDWSGVSVADALRPVIEWAEEAAPEELAEIYPEGGLVYTEAMGRRWVRLLGEWREATNDGA